MTTHIVYIRTSSENPAHHADQYDTQLSQFPFDDPPYRIFADQGVSGTKDPKTRTGFERMLMFLEDHPQTTVHVSGLDRLGRGRTMEDAKLLLFELDATIQEAKTGIHHTHLSDDDISSWLLQEMNVLFSEYERRSTVSRLKAGKDRARSQGRHTGGSVPFGYTKDANGFLVEDDDEQGRIRTFCDAIQAGMAVAKAAEVHAIPAGSARRIAAECRGAE